MEIDNGTPYDKRGYLDNGFEELYPKIIANPYQWIRLKNVTKSIALSIKRAVRLTNDNVAVTIKSTEDGLKDVFFWYEKPKD